MTNTLPARASLAAVISNRTSLTDAQADREAGYALTFFAALLAHDTDDDGTPKKDPRNADAALR